MAVEVPGLALAPEPALVPGRVLVQAQVVELMVVELMVVVLVVLAQAV